MVIKILKHRNNIIGHFFLDSQGMDFLITLHEYSRTHNYYSLQASLSALIFAAEKEHMNDYFCCQK